MAQSSGAGMMIMVFAAVLFGISDIAIKVFGGALSPWQISCGRGFLGMVGVLLVLKFNYRVLLVRQWPIQLGLGLAGALGFTFFVISIKYLPLSIAMPLVYVFPAIGALLSPVINNEKPNQTDWLAIALALIAVICLSRGAAGQVLEKTAAAGLLFGLAGAFLVALMTNLARRQTRSAALSVNLFYLFLGNFSLCFPLILLLDAPIVPPAAELAKLFLVIAPASVFGFCLMFIAYRSITSFRGGAIMMLEAAAASFYGVVWLGEPLTFFMISGGLLMLLSSIIIAKSNARKKESDA